MPFFQCKKDYIKLNLHTVLFSFILLALLSFSVNATEESKSVFKLGERFFSDSLYNLALEQYQKYLNLKRGPENDPVAYYKLAFCHHKMGNLNDAAEGFEEYIRLFPSETNIMDVMYLAGKTRKELKNFQQASDWFYAIWTRFVGSAKARLALFEAALCAELDNNSERAIELYALFVKRFPQNEHAKQVSLSLVKLYIERQEYTQADEVLGRVKNLWKSDKFFPVRVTYYQALLAKVRQNIDKAEELFVRMEQNDKAGFPERETAYKAYIEVLTQRKKYKQAQQIFEKINTIYTEKSRKPEATFIKAWADNARKARLFSKAVPLYKQLIAHFPDVINSYQIQYRLAECYVGLGNFPNAFEHLRTLSLQDSAGEYSARAVLKTGELYFKKGLYPSAITAFRNYVQLPNRQDKDKVMYRIGKVYQDKYEQYSAAVREFESLIKLYPSSQYYQKAVFAMAQCQEAIKEYQTAVRNYEYLVESGGDKDIVGQAKSRASYIRGFLVKDYDAAVMTLTDLVAKNSSLVGVERKLKTAHIFTTYLKDFHRALELYNELSSSTDLSDSLSALITLKMAHVYSKLKEKALFEKDQQMQSHAKEKAIAHFKKVIDSYGTTGFADEAAYSLMVLTAPNISEYETFLTTYGKSKYLPDVLISIAEHYETRAQTVGKKFSTKAIDAYKEIVDMYPSHRHTAKSYLGLARNHVTLGNVSEAKQAIQVFVQRFSGTTKDAEAFYIEGLLAERDGAHTEAVEHFKQVLYRFPFSVFAERSRYELAASEFRTGKIFDALSNYRLYIQNYPEGLYALDAELGIAKSLFKLGKNSEAIGVFDVLLAKKIPDRIKGDIHYQLALFAEEDGENYKAIEHFKKSLAVESFPLKLTAFKKMGALYAKGGTYDKAADSYDKALTLIRTESDSVDLMTRKISALVMDGKSKKADKHIGEFKGRFGKKYPGSIAEITFHKGLYLQSIKEYDKSVKRFQYVLQKHETSDRADDAAYQIALSRYYANKAEDALKEFQKFTVEYPTSEFVPLALFKIAMIYHGQNDFVRSADFFTKVIHAEKVDKNTRFRAANNAAMAYQKANAWLEAADKYSIVIADYADMIHKSSFHLKLGFCLLKASRIEDALKQFKAADMDPKKEDKPEVIYWIATCYSKLGEYTKAIAEYLKVPYLYSSADGKWAVTAEFEAARLYERQGEYSKAVTLYRKIVRSDGLKGRFGKLAHERIEQLNTLIREG